MNSKRPTLVLNSSDAELLAVNVVSDDMKRLVAALTNATSVARDLLKSV